MAVSGRLLGTIAGLLVFIFVFPRVLVQMLGPENPWTSYLYMYGFGLITFMIGIWVIRSSGALVLGRGHDSYWYKVLIGGYLFFAALHGFWVFIAVSTPVKG